MPGVISAGGPATAAAGAAMLAQGGNAVDAAVAAAFASFIAEIGVVHLGGSGMAQIFNPHDGRAIAYDFFSAMPGLGRAGPVERLDFEKVTVDFGPATQDFYLGRGSVAVPGNIAGLCRMAGDYGRLPLSTLLAPAIGLAREGVTIEPLQAEICLLLAPLYTHTPAMRALFTRDGRMIAPGKQLFIPDLACTLEALAREGAEYARTGRLAQALLADQAANGGLLTPADLESYQVRQLSPIRLRYRDCDILLPPPSSSGGVLTAFSLKLLNHFDLRHYVYGSARHLQLLYEVMAATSRARPAWDHSLATRPERKAINTFLSGAFIQEYVDEVRAALAGRQRRPALPEVAAHPDTSHLSVIDGDGLAVSLTTTAGESAGYVVPNTGYIPNNMLGEADLHPGGFHSRPAGERIPTMMTPAIVLHHGRIRLVVGSGGSTRIRSAILQVLSNLLDFKMKLVEAVNSARVHVEDGLLHCELGYDPAAVDELEQMGYPIQRWDRRSLYFGGAHSVSRAEDGRLVAAGDDRRGGAAIVVP
ncbi:MAG: gamma-glutamyltransferase [Chloroflexi bacterium]|nr:gamma-glutamyltransferase [Chloroflexota bacterium]MCI0576468.1 gamma-glutamyltransferase [Chloroflexota bacterium]MCI0649556.1 gamma-glutamyltransferase [Chloroflexota bacterium]MCI0729368.1 gamma-glutamyltransferase [Chloroflexota bacterium]